MKYILSILFSLALLGQASNSAAQYNTDPAVVKTMVEGRNYIFKAQSVTPQQGRFRQLTSEYDLTVSGDSVISYLPYFGRAYVAPVGNAEGGIKFTSTKFDYSSEKRKKNSWEISIVPKDAGTVQQLNLTIFDNGSASLRVSDRNRQNISFNGYVIEGKEKPKKAF